LRPYAVVFLVLLFLTLAASLVGVALGLWQAGRGPRRARAMVAALACLGPPLMWLAVGAEMLNAAAEWRKPTGPVADVGTMAAASAMEAQARFRYRHRLEGQRLVMFHNGVATPERDLAAMEAHVARLEALTGRPLRARIYWVRGKLLGHGRLTLRGLALGSDTSPDDWDFTDHPIALDADRHELAHAVIHQFQPHDADPPTLLVEGWANVFPDTSSRGRAAAAVGAREQWRARGGTGSYLRELTGPAWYHRIDSPVYHVGGAFADYLIRRFGMEAFLSLYGACRPATFGADCEEHLGVGLEALEAGFWKWAEQQAKQPDGGRAVGPLEVGATGPLPLPLPTGKVRG
jgi:hypothetical protein